MSRWCRRRRPGAARIDDVDDTTSDSEQFFDAAAREASGTVLRQAFVAAQLGMPSEDFETAVETLWIIFEALLIDHVASGETDSLDCSEQRASLEDRWRRLVTAAVIHTFVLSGDFVMPEALLVAVDERATRLADGQMWHTRRPPAQGALVLGVHAALLHLERTAATGRYPDKDDSDALVEIIALATLGAVLARGTGASRIADVESGEDRPEEAEQSGRWARSSQAVAESFGIAGVQLVAVRRDGWACDVCGCVFVGRVEAGIAYPDRMAPVGRGGPCDSVTACACHEAPLQRRVR